MSILVFGSLNMDLVACTPRLPVPGETLTGDRFFTASGGKGANQAVAAAKLGVATWMVGRVGGDGFGSQLLEGLRSTGVHTDGVLVDGEVHSGVAVIAVDAGGENSIIVVPGANGRVDHSDVTRLTPFLKDAKVLLLQLEIPLPAVLAAAQAARDAGVCVILDPAPARWDLPKELYRAIDMITPNEVEAKQLTGIQVENEETAAAAAGQLRQWGVAVAIVKLGTKGVYCATAQEQFFLPAFPVVAVDTVAAGDAFNGAMAAAIAQGLPLRQALTWGAAAGALSVTQPGAQSALPHRSTFDAFLQNRL